jgi:hypothetical protein
VREWLAHSPHLWAGGWSSPTGLQPGPLGPRTCADVPLRRLNLEAAALTVRAGTNGPRPDRPPGGAQLAGESPPGSRRAPLRTPVVIAVLILSARRLPRPRPKSLMAVWGPAGRHRPAAAAVDRSRPPHPPQRGSLHGDHHTSPRSPPLPRARRRPSRPSRPPPTRRRPARPPDRTACSSGDEGPEWYGGPAGGVSRRAGLYCSAPRRGPNAPGTAHAVTAFLEGGWGSAANGRPPGPPPPRRWRGPPGWPPAGRRPCHSRSISPAPLVIVA